MISITIPVVSGTRLREVLESVVSQDYKDFEIIAVNDRSDRAISKLLAEYSAKEVLQSGSLLNARFASAKLAVGDYVLQLDETRRLSDNRVLSDLSKIDADAIFLNETDFATNFWSKAAAIDKRLLFTNNNILSKKHYVIPRYYRRNILIQSFLSLVEKIGPKLESLTAPEDLLVYLEALQILRSRSAMSRIVIVHYGDNRLKQIVRKYYRYGADFNLLRDTTLDKVVNVPLATRLNGRFDQISSFHELFPVLILWSVRGISFSLGKSTGRCKVL